MNVAAAFPVRDSSEVSEPRRAAGWLADSIGFSETRAGLVSLVASELATNLAKHARDGELLLRAFDDGSGRAAGVEILSLDTGPGIADVDASRRAGHSTTGTLGHGLTAIERQSDFTDIYTLPTGTAMVSRIWREVPPGRAAEPRIVVGAVNAAKPGEDISGDGWAWRLRAQRMAMIVADGLGHGLHAHDAALAALDTFAKEHEHTPARIVEDAHAALRGTRGAALAVLSLDFDYRTVRYCGLGNISGTIMQPTARQSLVSMNGTAGHTTHRLQEFQYGLPANATIVMHSDGLSTHWDLGPYPGIRERDPSIIAGVLYRDFSRRRDDVTVVVAKLRE